MTQKSTHEKLSEAGRKGGEASHGGRGSESEERQSMSREEAGRKGAEAQSTEAKAKGGRQSHSGRD